MTQPTRHGRQERERGKRPQVAANKGHLAFPVAFQRTGASRIERRDGLEEKAKMFGWLKKKAAQQSLFNVEFNTRTLILISNKAYPDRPSSTSDAGFRVATAKVIKAQRNLLQDILLALDNGASLDEVRARIMTAKGKEATITMGAEMAIDTVIDEVAAGLRNLSS